MMNMANILQTPRIQRGDHKSCLENEDMGGGRGHFSEVTFKGGIG